MRKNFRFWTSVFMLLALACSIVGGTAPAATTSTNTQLIIPKTIITPQIPIKVIEPTQTVREPEEEGPPLLERPNTILPEIITPRTLVALPNWVIEGLKKPVYTKAFDKAFLEQGRLQAVKAPETHVMSGNTIPPSYDLTQYLTFTENQDGWGGCILRSIMHTIQIENEKKCRFTPDPSFWYVHQRQEYLANGGAVDTTGVLSNWGVCPEGSLPSNYDDSTQTSNGGWVFTSMPTPTVANDVEASYYKAYLSPAYTIDVNTMKQHMLQYGPILLGGPMVAIQGPNPVEGHCVTAVGWDDYKQAFKILNSWGDQWNGNGYIWIKYSDLASNCDEWRYIEDRSKDRTGTKFAYSARVNLHSYGSAMRNQLAIKIGVVGKGSGVFWDHFNQVACRDESRNLSIDVPLPDWAASCWPPSDDNIWYIEVTNDNGDEYRLQNFTIAKQTSVNSVESYPWTYSMSNVIPGNSKQTFAIPHLAQITLQEPNNMHNGWVAGSKEHIMWNTSPDDIGSVNIYFSQNGGSSWTPVGTTDNNDGYPWTVPNLNISNARILVELVVDGVVVAQADSGSFAIGPATSLFKTPTNLAAKAYGKKIHLTWDDNNQLDGVQYVIERKGVGEDFIVLATIPQNSAYIDEDTYPKDAGSMLYTEKTYIYRVRAVNGQQYSAYTNEATATADFMTKLPLQIPRIEPLKTKPIEILHELPIPNPDWKTAPNLSTPITTSPVATGNPTMKFIIGDSGYLANSKRMVMDTPPIIHEGRTFMPIRYVADNLGATVAWNQDEQKATVTSSGKIIELWIGNNTARVDGTMVKIDAANDNVTPILTGGRTMLPLRFIAEQLDCQVDWNEATQEINIQANN